MTPVGRVASTGRDSNSNSNQPGHGMLDVDLLEDAYYEVDLAGRMLRFNPAASAILGYPSAELFGKHYREYMPPEVAEQVKDLFGEVYQGRRASRSADWVMVRPDGTSRSVEGSVSLARGADGEPIGFYGIIRDVTEQRHAQQALRESEERFRALTSLSTDWYWEQDAEYRMVRFEGSRANLRYDPARIVIGRRLWELPRMLDLSNWAKHRATLDARRAFRDFEYAYRSASGKRYYVSISGAPIFDADGRFTGYRGTSRDITREKHERRLLELEHRVTHALSLATDAREALASVLEAAGQSEEWDTGGYFELIDASGRARLLEVYCGPDLSEATANRYRARVGSDTDRPMLFAAAASSGDCRWIPDIADIMDPDSPWRELLMQTGERTLLLVPVLGDGRALGVLAFASRWMREPDDRLQRAMRVIAGQVGQFLRRKAAERVLRESEARFRALTRLSTDWYWEVDTGLQFTRIGDEHGDLGRSESGGAALGRHPWQIGLKLGNDRSWPDVADTMRRGEPIRDVEVFRRDRERGIAWYSISAEPMRDEAGRFAGYRGIGRNITDRMLAEQHIQRMATHDSLTGLPNRAHFTEMLERAVENEAGPFAVLFIDLDGFKQVNDSLGHEAGDALLRETAARLRGCLRADDVVGRLGGDEFVVLALGLAECAEAARIAGKITALVGQPLRVDGHSIRVTPSIGIAMHPDCADSAAGLMRASDLAMYEAKRTGKNRHAFFADLQPGSAGAPAPGLPGRNWAPV